MTRPRVPSTRSWFAIATVLTLAWGVLAFGAEYAWAYAPLMVLCLTVGGVGLLAPDGPSLPRPVLLGLGAVLLAAAIQATPLPRAAVTALSPTRYDVDWAQMHSAAVATTPLGPEAAAQTVTPPSTVSIWPSRSWLGLGLYVSLAVLFLGATRALGPLRASGLVRGLVVLGVVVAIVSLVQRASGSRLVYGVWEHRYPRAGTAPFVNGNHLAGWLVMTLSVAVGYLGGAAARAMRGVRPDWRSRLLWLGSAEASQVVLTGMAVLTMAVALIVTLSRSGIVALLVALGVAGLWAARRQTGRMRRVVVPAVLVLVLAVAVGRGGIDRVGREFERASWDTLGGRLPIWSDTVEIVRDFPLTGTGLNTYGIAMLAYQTYSDGRRAVEAHNDYLQLVAEGGLLLGLPVLGLVLVAGREIRGRFDEAADDTMTYWIRVGACTGLVAIALQSTVEFSLQMPGNAALFAVLLALGVHRPAVRRRPGTSEGPTSLRT